MVSATRAALTHFATPRHGVQKGGSEAGQAERRPPPAGGGVATRWAPGAAGRGHAGHHSRREGERRVTAGDR